MTAPANAAPAADPRRSTRRRLVVAVVLIGLAAAGLAIVEQFRERPAILPAPHEPSQALIAPPAAAPATTPEAGTANPQLQPAAPPPPPVVVNEPDRPPPPATTARATPALPADAATYLVQAGVFASPANARSLQQRLAKAGIRAKVETRVQLGPYKDRHEAEQALARLKKLGVNAVMVPAR